MAQPFLDEKTAGIQVARVNATANERSWSLLPRVMEKTRLTEASTRILAAAPQFAVQDVVRTAEYYRDVLGFHIASY
jgi:hypothetical protein